MVTSRMDDDDRVAMKNALRGMKINTELYRLNLALDKFLEGGGNVNDFRPEDSKLIIRNGKINIQAMLMKHR